MNNTEQIEVELRGPLDEKEYELLLAYCKEHGRYIGRENRFLVDYSTFIEGIGTRTLDVRVRITNGQTEIVTKKGAFGGTSRSEAIVHLQNSDAVSAFRLMGMLGYRRGVACDRGISRYSIHGIEIAIQDVRHYGSLPELHSRFYEAEILCSPDEVSQAEMRIRDFVNSIQLRLFNETEWNTYVVSMNKEANGVFDLDGTGLADLETYKLGCAE